MPTTTETRRVPGWERVLNAFMAAPDRTLTNVELGQIPGVQAFHQRISDLRRYGYVLTDAVLVKKGHYAYKLVGLVEASEYPHTGPRPHSQTLALLDKAQALLGQSVATNQINAKAETLAERSAPPAAPAPVAGARMTRDAVALLQETLGDHVADWRPADREDLLALVRKVVELREDSREVAAELNRQLADLQAERDALRSAVAPGPALMRKALEWCEQPMHYKRIAAYVMENGGGAYYKGATPETTIVRHLVKSDKDPAGEFVKVSSGVFALREWEGRVDEFGNALLELDPVR